jgi:MSHA biogenesis protein MshP
MTMRQDPSAATMRQQHGFSLVSAIFLMVVLAALGAAIVNVSTMQHTGSALDVQGTRAYQAARAGIEWGVYRQIKASVCIGETSFVPPAPTLSGFTVTVRCALVSDPKTIPPTNAFRIESTACNQPNASGHCPGTAGGTFYVERQLQVKL